MILTRAAGFSPRESSSVGDASTCGKCAQARARGFYESPTAGKSFFFFFSSCLFVRSTRRVPFFYPSVFLLGGIAQVGASRMQRLPHLGTSMPKATQAAAELTAAHFGTAVKRPSCRFFCFPKSHSQGSGRPAARDPVGRRSPCSSEASGRRPIGWAAGRPCGRAPRGPSLPRAPTWAGLAAHHASANTNFLGGESPFLRCHRWRLHLVE